MSGDAFDFLQSWVIENVQSWVIENVNATICEDRDVAEHLADDCIWEANTRGITEVP
jgi:hypothetical protein